MGSLLTEAAMVKARSVYSMARRPYRDIEAQSPQSYMSVRRCSRVLSYSARDC